MQRSSRPCLFPWPAPCVASSLRAATLRSPINYSVFSHFSCSSPPNHISSRSPQRTASQKIASQTYRVTQCSTFTELSSSPPPRLHLQPFWKKQHPRHSRLHLLPASLSHVIFENDARSFHKTLQGGGRLASPVALRCRSCGLASFGSACVAPPHRQRCDANFHAAGGALCNESGCIP